MPRTLTPEAAKGLLLEWGSYRHSNMYALGKYGRCLDRNALLAEIKAQTPSDAEHQRDLIRLYNYVLTQLEHRPADAYPWRAPWAKEKN